MYSHVYQFLETHHNWFHNSHMMHTVNSLRHMEHNSVRVLVYVGEEEELVQSEPFSYSLVYQKVWIELEELALNFVTYSNPCKRMKVL